MQKEEQQIYRLLQSSDEKNIVLAIELATGLNLELREYWDDLEAYYQYLYGKKAPNKLALSKIFRQTNICVRDQIWRKDMSLRFLKWTAKLTSIEFSNVKLEEVPTTIIKNESLEILTLSKNHLSKLPESLASSHIRLFRINYNPKLDFEQLWTIALRMPKLKTLVWLNMVTIQFDANKQASFDHLGLRIPYNRHYIHYPNKLVSTFKHFSNIRKLYIDFQAPKDTDVIKLPTPLQDTDWEQFPSHFFDTFLDLEYVTFYGADWDWTHTLMLLVKLPKLKIIEIHIANSFKADISLQDGNIIIHNQLDYELSRPFHGQLMKILEGLTILAPHIKVIEIAPRVYLPNLPKSLSRFVALERLSLSKLKLQSIDIDWSNLKQLKEVDLSLNPTIDWAKSITQVALTPQLEKLNISHNKIEKLPISSINWNHLTNLHINHNQLKILPDWIKDLKQLKHLKINHNQIEELPNWLDQISLETLFIHDNNITNLTASIFQIPTLRKLYLTRNNIESLPSIDYSSSGLDLLDMSNNPLKFIAPEIASIKTLKTLRLDHCLLQSLPKSMASITVLQDLDLSYNKLEVIPKAIINLPMLERLILTSNQLIYTADTCFRLPMLKHLELGDNQLESLPNGLVHSKELKCLYAKNNPIKTLPNLKENPQLKSIILDNTLIKSLENITLTSNMNISLRGIYDFDWVGLYSRVQETKGSRVFWLKNKRLNNKKMSQFNLQYQEIQNWAPILTFIKSLYIPVTLLLQYNNIQYLGKEWENCDFIETLNLEGNPDLDLERSLPVFASMKNLKKLYLDKKLREWRPILQKLLGNMTHIVFGK